MTKGELPNGTLGQINGIGYFRRRISNFSQNPEDSGFALSDSDLESMSRQSAAAISRMLVVTVPYLSQTENTPVEEISVKDIHRNMVNIAGLACFDPQDLGTTGPKIYKRLHGLMDKAEGIGWKEAAILHGVEIYCMVANKRPNVPNLLDDVNFLKGNVSNIPKLVFRIMESPESGELSEDELRLAERARKRLDILNSSYIGEITEDSLRVALLAYAESGIMTSSADQYIEALSIKLEQTEISRATDITLAVFPELNKAPRLALFTALMNRHGNEIKEEGVLKESFDRIMLNDEIMQAVKDGLVNLDIDLEKLEGIVAYDGGLFYLITEFANDQQLSIFVNKLIEMTRFDQDPEQLFRNIYGHIALALYRSRAEDKVANSDKIVEMMREQTKGEPFANRLESFADTLLDKEPAMIVLQPTFDNITQQKGSEFSVVRRKPASKDAVILYKSASYVEPEEKRYEKPKVGESVPKIRPVIEPIAASKKNGVREIDAPIGFTEGFFFGWGEVLDPAAHSEEFENFIKAVSGNLKSLDENKLFEELIDAQEKFRTGGVLVSPYDEGFVLEEGKGITPDVASLIDHKRRSFGVDAVVLDFIRHDEIITAAKDAPILGFVPLSKDKETVLFVVDPNFMKARRNGTSGVAYVRGILNDAGELQLRGKENDPNFVASNEHMYLNLLALRAYSWPPLSKLEGQDLSDLRTWLKTYNQFGRKSNGIVLPELRIAENDVKSGIPVVIKGKKILLSPSAKK